jgi:hypothetical protein
MKHPGHRYCPRLADQLQFGSEHGDHCVLVTPLSGPSVRAVGRVFGADRMPLRLPVIKQWLREMFMVLDYMLESFIQVVNEMRTSSN